MSQMVSTGASGRHSTYTHATPIDSYARTSPTAHANANTGRIHRANTVPSTMPDTV